MPLDILGSTRDTMINAMSRIFSSLSRVGNESFLKRNDNLLKINQIWDKRL